MKTDFYQQITNNVISALESGVKPWVCPWECDSLGGLPYSFHSKQAYSGINILLLWSSAAQNGFKRSEWMTYKQAAAMGAQVRKGEKGTQIVFYKLVERKNADGEDEKIPMMRVFTVFNVAQIDGLELPEIKPMVEGTGFEALEHAEAFITDFDADITEEGDRAFYSPSTDKITVPERRRFTNADDFYATVFHEIIHKTGHPSRLNRAGGRFGDPDYAFEELVAELGAAFVCADFGITGDVQHESYIANWLCKLRNDKKFIFKAATAASRAHQFCIETVKNKRENAA